MSILRGRPIAQWAGRDHEKPRSVADYAAEGPISDPLYSPDRRWYWDGLAWQPVASRAGSAHPYVSATPLATAARIVIGVALVGYFFVVVDQLVTLAAAVGLVGNAVRTGTAVLSLPGGLLFFGGLLGGAITVPMWMYRNSRNLRALGAQGLRWSPGLSAGGWFIPLANLVIPFFALDELERSSRGQRDSPFVWVSWASMLQAWLFAALLIVVLIATTGLGVVAGALLIAAESAWMLSWALLIPVLREVTRAQDAQVGLTR